MTDNTLQELLPCPFCNIHVVETGRGYAVHHRAGCFMGAKGSTYFLPHELTAWNTRAQPAPAAGVVEPTPVEEFLHDMHLHIKPFEKDGGWIQGEDACGLLADPIRQFVAALPAPSVGEDEAVEIMYKSAAALGGKYRDQFRVAYRALKEKGIINA